MCVYEVDSSLVVPVVTVMLIVSPYVSLNVFVYIYLSIYCVSVCLLLFLHAVML